MSYNQSNQLYIKLQKQTSDKRYKQGVYFLIKFWILDFKFKERFTNLK